MSQRQATNVEEVVIEKRVTRSQRNKLQKEASSSVVEPKGASKRNRAGKNDFLDQLREVIGDEVQEKENIANNQSVKDEATPKSPTKNTKKKARNKKTVKFIDLTTQDSGEEENITKAVEPTPEVDVKPQRSTKRKGKKTVVAEEVQEDTTINKEPPKEKPKRGKGKAQPKTEAAAVEITKTPDDDAVSEETKEPQEPKRRGRNAKKTTKQETTSVDSNIIKTEAVPEKIQEEVIEKPKRNRRGKKESPQEVAKAPECEEVPESVEPEEKPKKGRRKAKAKPEKETPQESVEISNNKSPEKVEPVVVPEKGRRRRAKAKLEEEPPLEPAQDLDNKSPEEKTEIKKPKRVPRRAQTKEDIPLEPEVTTSRRRNRGKKDTKVVPEKEPPVELSTSPILINDSLTKESDIIIEELQSTPEIESTSSEQLAASPKSNMSIQIEEVPDFAENMDVSTGVEEDPVSDEPLEHFETTTEQKEIEETSTGLNLPQNEDLNEEKEVDASSEDFETLPEQEEPHFAQDVSIVFEREVSITCAPGEDFEMMIEQEETPEKNEDVSTDFEKEIYATDVPSEDNETSVNLEDPELAESSNVSKDFEENISVSDAESEDLKSLTLSEEYEVLPEEDNGDDIDSKDSEHEISVNDSGLLEKSHMEEESSFTALTNAEQTEPVELLNLQERSIENMDVSSESNVVEDQLSFSEKELNVSVSSPKISDQNESLQEQIQSVSNESSVENLLGKYIDYSISNNYSLTDKKATVESNSQVENFTLFLNLDDSEECINTSLAESEDRSKIADTSSQKSPATTSKQEEPNKSFNTAPTSPLVNKLTEKTSQELLKDQTFASEDCINASLQVQCEPGELEVTGSEISSFNNSSVYSTMSTNIGDEESPRESINNGTVDLSSMLQKNLRFTPQSVRKCKTPKSASKIGNKFYSPMENTEEYFSEEYSEPSTTNFEDFVAPTVTQEVSLTSLEENNVVEAPIEQTPMTAISQLLQNNLKFTPDTVNVETPEAAPKLGNKFYEIVENDEDIAKKLDESIAATDHQEISPTPFEENHVEEAPIGQTPMTAISEMLQNNLIFTPNAVQVQSPEVGNQFYEIVENDDHISEQLDESTTEYLDASPKTQEQKSPTAPIEKQSVFDTPKHNSLEDLEDIIEQTPMTAISKMLQNNLKFTSKKATPQSASKLGNKFYNLAENDGLVEQLDNSSVEFESLETPKSPRENLFNSPEPNNHVEAEESIKNQSIMNQEPEENISVQLSASFLHNLRITPKSVKKQTPKKTSNQIPTDSDATSNESFRTANLDNNSSFNSSNVFRTPKTTSSFGTPRTLKSRAVPNIVITQATPFADIPSTPTNTPVKNLRSTTTPSTSGKGTPKNTPAAETTRVLRSVTPKMTPAQQLRAKTYTPRSDVKTSSVQNVSRTATPVRQISTVRGTPRSEVKTTPLRVSHENTPIRQLRTGSFTPRSGVKQTPNKNTSPNNSFAQSVSPKTTPIQVRTAAPKFTPSVGVKQTPNKTMTPKNTPSLSVSPKSTPIQQLRSGMPRFTPTKSTISKNTPALSVSPKATPIQQLRTETPNRTPRSVVKNTPIQNVSRMETSKMPHLSVSRTATPKATPKDSVSPSATPKNTPNASVARIGTPKTTPGEYSKLTRAVTPKNTPIPSVLTPKNQARKGFSTLFAQTDVTRLEDVELTLVENSMLLDRAESPEYVHQMSKIDESEESVILIDTESETENDSSLANLNDDKSFTSSLKTRDSYVTAKDVTTVVDSESDSEEPQQYLSAPSNETSFTSMLSSKNTTGTFYTAKNTLCGFEINTTGESIRTLESENAHFNSFATRSHNTSLFSGVTPLEKTNDSTVSSQMIEELQYESAPHEESAEAPNVDIKVDSFNESSFEISMHFNDTLDDMEKALKYGLDYSTDDGIETSPNKSVNDLEANRAPPQIISGSFMSAPSTMLGSSSRIPRFNEPKPSTSKQSPFKVPLLAKTPKSCLKAKPFQNVVSPIGIYIKNTPAPFQVKKVTPTVNNRGAIPKIPKPTVPRGKQRAHKNLVESLPEVVYKPSKISSESSCKEISLPESIQQYLCNTQIIKHDTRLHATPKPSGAAVTNKLLQGDLTCIEDDEQNISVRTKKQTFKF